VGLAGDEGCSGIKKIDEAEDVHPVELVTV
jgi:hypothetical protein